MPNTIGSDTGGREAEPSVAALLEALRRNARLLSISAFVVTAASAALLMSLPRSFERRLQLAIRSPSLGFAGEAPDALAAAVPALKLLRLDGVTVSPRLDKTGTELTITLRSRQSTALESARASALECVRTVRMGLIDHGLADRLRIAESAARRADHVRAGMERELARVPIRGVEKRRALTEQWARIAAEGAALEFDRQQLLDARRDLSRSTAKALPLVVEGDTGPRPAPGIGRGQAAILALATGMIAAVLLALVREQWMRRPRTERRQENER